MNMVKTALLVLSLTHTACWADEFSLEQITVLQEFVHQDCGSCHGLSLKGGLGPAITKEALKDKNIATIGAIIRHGRPGTPMPPWSPVLDQSQIDWIANYLKNGILQP